MSFDINAHLRKLGWKEGWTILTEEQWQPLANVPGYENKVYDSAKDPESKEQFGKNARVVRLDFWNEHKPKPETPPAVAPQETTASTIPEPPKASGIPEPPKPKGIPEPPKKEEEQKTPGATEKPKADIELRKAQLISLGWEVGGDDDDSLVSKKGKLVSLKELGELSDMDFFVLMANKEEPKPKVEKEESKLELRLKNLSFKGFKIIREEQVVTVLNRSYSFEDIEELPEEDYLYLARQKMLFSEKEVEEKEKAPEPEEKSIGLITAERVKEFADLHYKLDEVNQEVNFGPIATKYEDIGKMTEEGFDKFFQEMTSKFPPNDVPKTKEELERENKEAEELKASQKLTKSRKKQLEGYGFEEISTGTWKLDEHGMKVTLDNIVSLTEEEWAKMIEKIDFKVSEAKAIQDRKDQREAWLKENDFTDLKEGKYFHADLPKYYVEFAKVNKSSEDEWESITATLSQNIEEDQASDIAKASKELEEKKSGIDFKKAIAEKKAKKEFINLVVDNPEDDEENNKAIDEYEAQRKAELIGTDKNGLTPSANGGLFSLLADVGFQQYSLSFENQKKGNVRVVLKLKDPKHALNKVTLKPIEGKPEVVEETLRTILKSL